MAYSNLKKIAEEVSAAATKQQSQTPCSLCQKPNPRAELAMIEDCGHVLCGICMKEAENWTEFGQITCQVCLNKINVPLEEDSRSSSTASESQSEAMFPPNPALLQYPGFVRLPNGALIQQDFGHQHQQDVSFANHCIAFPAAPPYFVPNHSSASYFPGAGMPPNFFHHQAPVGNFLHPHSHMPPPSSVPHNQYSVPPSSLFQGFNLNYMQHGAPHPSTLQVPAIMSNQFIRDHNVSKLIHHTAPVNPYQPQRHQAPPTTTTPGGFPPRFPVQYRPSDVPVPLSSSSSAEASRAGQGDFAAVQQRASSNNSPNYSVASSTSGRVSATTTASKEDDDTDSMSKEEQIEECHRKLRKVMDNLQLQLNFIAHQKTVLGMKVNNFMRSITIDLHNWASGMHAAISGTYSQQLAAISNNQGVIQQLKENIDSLKHVAEDGELLKQKVQACDEIQKAEKEVGRVLPIYEFLAQPSNLCFGSLLHTKSVCSPDLIAASEASARSSSSPSSGLQSQTQNRNVAVQESDGKDTAKGGNLESKVPEKATSLALNCSLEMTTTAPAPAPFKTPVSAPLVFSKPTPLPRQAVVSPTPQPPATVPPPATSSHIKPLPPMLSQFPCTNPYEPMVSQAMPGYELFPKKPEPLMQPGILSGNGISVSTAGRNIYNSQGLISQPPMTQPWSNFPSQRLLSTQGTMSQVQGQMQHPGPMQGRLLSSPPLATSVQSPQYAGHLSMLQSNGQSLQQRVTPSPIQNPYGQGLLQHPTTSSSAQRLALGTVNTSLGQAQLQGQANISPQQPPTPQFMLEPTTQVPKTYPYPPPHPRLPPGFATRSTPAPKVYPPAIPAHLTMALANVQLANVQSAVSVTTSNASLSPANVSSSSVSPGSNASSSTDASTTPVQSYESPVQNGLHSSATTSEDNDDDSNDTNDDDEDGDGSESGDDGLSGSSSHRYRLRGKGSKKSGIDTLMKKKLVVSKINDDHTEEETEDDFEDAHNEWIDECMDNNW